MRQAAEFTARALEKPFTIHIRWRSLFGAQWLGLVIDLRSRTL